MEKKWWHNKIAYQIYPKSFLDTNGDGIGDLPGIISKLDYLKKLGIDIIWISPIYKSPFVDQGYDIADYQQIDPIFGTMEDFDTLLEEAHKRDMYIIMDLVINHCSDQHRWFQAALKNPEGEYGKYFYFRKGENSNSPSNYRSYFGGSCWEKVTGTDYYYLHMFAKEQPDLNWENPQLRQELYNMINWWLNKGLDGFRVDAIINIKKDLDFKSLPPDGPDGLAACWRMVESVQGVGELLADLRDNTFAKHDAFTVGEVFNIKLDELKKFIGDQGYFSTMFDFSTHLLTYGKHGWYDSKPVSFEDYRRVTVESQLACQDIGFLANIIENHDEPRGVSTYLPKYLQNPVGATLLAATNILLRGMPFIYQGQEIGMENCHMDSIEDYDDISTKDQYHLALKAGLTSEKALEICYANSRDNARTPMQWDNTENAGFTIGTPWLKVNPNYVHINVADQEEYEGSVLDFYRKLIALRKSDEYVDLFTYGEFVPMCMDMDNVFAYKRKLDAKSVLILGNWGENTITLHLEDIGKKKILLNNLVYEDISSNKVTLKRGQVLVLG